MSRVKSQFATVSILVVDDNVDVLSILKLVLRSLGCKKVHCANDAAEGFEIFCQNKIDLIIVDYNMPTLDGIEFVQLVRKADDSPNKKVPIIMVSAYSELANVKDAKEAGVNDFLRKPVSMKILNERINNALTINQENKPEENITQNQEQIPEEVNLDEIEEKSVKTA